MFAARQYHPVDLGEVEVIGSTDHAIRVRFDERETAWIPRKAIHPSSQVEEEGDCGFLIVHRWFGYCHDD